jgi:transposase
MFSKREGEEKQGDFWIERARVSKPKSQGFYSKLNEHLAEMDFARQVWGLCAPAYCEESRGGRPGIDPVVYLKMLMVGFFENLRSERAIAARCEDSLSVRAFLGYGLEESTPDHSSLSVIRQRLGPEIYQGVFEVVLAALKAHGLFRGRHLGIDSSVIEANASLRTLVHRNTEEAYWEYVKELAAKEGVDPEDQGAVRRFDTKRPARRTSNEEWKNPHDPQAKVGRTKDGACDMIYKPEHVTDLENGAIVQVEVLEGDHPDTKALSERVACAVEVVNRIVANERDGVVRSLTADKGYFAIEEIAQIQEFDIRTVIGDAHAARRRKEALSAPLRKALHRAACAVKSQSGKVLLRKRGMHLERSFEHLLDEGGLRRATLQGTENLTKRYKIAAACFNLSLLMRTLLGVGTPKQWMAGAHRLLEDLIAYLRGRALQFFPFVPGRRTFILVFSNFLSECRPQHETR